MLKSRRSLLKSVAGTAGTLAALLAPRRLDRLHVGEVVDANRQLDQMQRHRSRLVRAASPLKRRISTAPRTAWYARNSRGGFATHPSDTTVFTQSPV